MIQCIHIYISKYIQDSDLFHVRTAAFFISINPRSTANGLILVATLVASMYKHVYIDIFRTWNFRTMYTTNVNNLIFDNTRYNPYVPRLGYAEHAIFSLKVFAL